MKKVPAKYLIVSRCMWKGEEQLWRVGVAKTVERAEEIIKETKREMANTYGGLIAPPSSPPKTYEIWEATWTQVK